MANEWLDNMLGNKISKEAMESQGTDKQDHFERKVAAHAWIKEVSDLDPVEVEAEYREKLQEEAKMLGKTAALDDVIADGVTPEETVNRDYKRDVASLSDYALAEMLAEARGHKAQNTNEMFYELKEKAKAEVASSRDKAEKALLELIPDNAQLDWQKAFKEYTKDATPAEPKEKDLYKSDVPEKAHDFQHPTEEKFKLPKDPEKAIPGNGREADERTDVTAEAGVLQKDIVEGTSKEASLKVEALYPSDFEGRENDQDRIKVFQKDIRIGKAGKITVLGSVVHYSFGGDHWSAYVTTTSYDATGKSNMSSTGAILWHEEFKSKEEAVAALKEWEDINTDSGAPQAQAFKTAAGGYQDTLPAGNQSGGDANEAAVREAFKQAVEGGGEEIMIDLLMRYMPVEDMKSILDDFSDTGEFSPDAEHFEHAGVPMATAKLKTHILNKKAAACPICGTHGKEIKTSAQENMACDSCGVTYAKASIEIKARASKTETIKKIAELQKTAEVASPWAVTVDEQGNEVIARVDHPTNTKESEEDKTTELQK